MPFSLTLKPLLKPGVTDLVLTSEGRLSVRTFGRWTSGLKADFRELFILVLDEIEPGVVARLKAGERCVAKMLSAEQGLRLRALVYESMAETIDRVIEISLRVIPQKIPAPGAELSRRALEALSERPHGFFLIAGGAGQGKSTLAASLIQDYLKRTRARAVVFGDPHERFFKEDGLVTYQSVPPTTAAIEQSLWLSPSLLVAENIETAAVKNRLAQAGTTQLVVSTVQAQDTISALQAWLSTEGVASELFAHSLAGVFTVALDGDGVLFKPRYQVTLFGEETGEGEFTLRTLLSERDWTRLRRRLHDDNATSARRVA